MHEVVLQRVSVEEDEVTIQHWFREEGDQVQEGEDLLEVMTEDGSVRIRVPASGRLSEVFSEEGDTVTVGEVLCEIDTD